MSVKELNIRLDGLELTPRDMVALERDVNALVLKYVAGTKQSGMVGSITGKGAITLGHLNPEWLGIWIKNFPKKELFDKKFTELNTSIKQQP